MFPSVSVFMCLAVCPRHDGLWILDFSLFLKQILCYGIEAHDIYIYLIFKALTGERKMSAKSITKFFEPLHKYLKATNAKNDVKAGWKTANQNKAV